MRETDLGLKVSGHAFMVGKFTDMNRIVGNMAANTSQTSKPMKMLPF